MRVVIIGGTGHVGTYLVPRLVEAGHEVIRVTRGKHAPYRPDDAWQSVHAVQEAVTWLIGAGRVPGGVKSRTENRQ